MLTDYTRNKIIDALHGKASYVAPATRYLGLSTTTPTQAGTNFTEPSGNGYARVAMPTASMASASGGVAANTAAYNFPAATGSGWGTVTYLGVFDALTGGNLLSADDLPSSQAVPAGVAPYVDVGQFVDSI